jgi:hypothetical protein
MIMNNGKTATTIKTNSTAELIRHEVKIRELETKLTNLATAHSHLLDQYRLLRGAFKTLVTTYSCGQSAGVPENFVFPGTQTTFPRY